MAGRRFTLSHATVAVLVLALGVLLFGRNGPIGSRLSARSARLAAESLVRSLWAPLSATTTRLGSATRDAQLVMFTDYHCSYCQEADRVISGFLRTHPEISIAVRHLPVSGPSGEQSASLAICAAEQGAFGEASAVLYQAAAKTTGAVDVTELLQATGSLAPEPLAACLSSERPRTRLAADIEFAKQIGIRGTPTFLTQDGSIGHLPELSGILNSVAEQ